MKWFLLVNCFLKLVKILDSWSWPETRIFIETHSACRNKQDGGDEFVKMCPNIFVSFVALWLNLYNNNDQTGFPSHHLVLCSSGLMKTSVFSNTIGTWKMLIYEKHVLALYRNNLKKWEVKTLLTFWGHSDCLQHLWYTHSLKCLFSNDGNLKYTVAP